MLNGESVDVPEDIVADWSLRFPRSATATGTHTPKAIFSVDDTVKDCRTCVPECTCYKIVKSLVDDHPL